MQKNLISLPKVWLSKHKSVCFVSYAYKNVKVKTTIVHVATKHRSLKSLSHCFNGFMEAKSDKLSPLPSYSQNNINKAHFYNYEHLIYFVNRNQSRKMSLEQSVIEAFCLLTTIMCENTYISYKAKNNIVPFIRKLKLDNVEYNSIEATIVDSQGKIISLEVINKIEHNVLCVILNDCVLDGQVLKKNKVILKLNTKDIIVTKKTQFKEKR